MSDDFSWVFLDNTGIALQNEAVDELKRAIDNLDECIISLNMQKGIGAEQFCIGKIEELQSTISKYKTNLMNLPRY